MARTKHYGLLRRLWRYEGGFSFAELLITITIMGILAAIAGSFWWEVVESRRVDSAARQLVADLRWAHDSATNQLEDYQVSVPTPDSPTYSIIGPTGPPSSRDLNDGTTSDVVTVGPAATITFKPDESAVLSGGGSSVTLTVSLADGENGDRCYDIEVRAATSRVNPVDGVVAAGGDCA